MDEFGSPLTGGITAVRRNISSSFFGAPQTQQPDTITTDLLQEQSLKITSVSGQLQNISRQISVLDFNIKSVRENIALGDQLERQREAAKQNRERILAEQGLREGKESALEQKIQSALVFPLQRIGAKTQGILGQLGKFLLTLAGGWLTLTGVDLLQSMAEGNIDKINKLKTKFLVGLTTVLGSLTAISIGMKKTLAILSVFGGNVARIAFGGLFRSSLFGVRLLLAGLVRKAAGLGNLTGGQGPVESLARLAADIVLIRLFGRLFDVGGGGKNLKNLVTIGRGAFTNKGRKFNKVPVTGDTGILDRIFNKNPLKKTKVISKTKSGVPITGTNVVKDTTGTLGAAGIKFFSKTMPKFNYPGPIRTAQDLLFKSRNFIAGKTKGLVTAGKGLLDDGIKSITSSKFLTKLGIKTGGKGVLKSLSKKLPLIGAVAGLVFGIERALAGDNLGAGLEIISGILGATGVGVKGSIGIDAFLIGRDLSKTNTKTDDNESEQIYRIPEGGKGDLIPIKTDKERIDKISKFTEDDVEIIMADNTNNENSEGSAVNSSNQGYLPDIRFDRQNPYSLSTSSLLGIGD